MRRPDAALLRLNVCLKLTFGGSLACAAFPHPGYFSAVRGASAFNMNRKNTKKSCFDRDTLKPEYDFSKAVRGATSARYAEGVNVVVIDPEVLDVFPDGASVNEAPRALAPVLRRTRKAHRRRSA